MPISRPATSVTTGPSRAGARPSGLMPTRLRAAPSASSAGRDGAEEAALARRRGRLPIDQTRSASTGEMVFDIVAVEAEARLEAERIARAKADRLHPLVGQQRGPTARPSAGTEIS